MVRREIREELENLISEVSNLKFCVKHYKECIDNRKAKIAVHQLESLTRKWENKKFAAFNFNFDDVAVDNLRCYFCKSPFVKKDEIYAVGENLYAGICFHKRCWDDNKNFYYYGILLKWMDKDGKIKWDREKELLIYAYLNAEAERSITESELEREAFRRYLVGACRWEVFECYLKNFKRFFKQDAIKKLTGDAGKHLFLEEDIEKKDVYEENKKILVDDDEEEYRKRIEALKKEKEKLEKEKELVKEEFYYWDEKYKALQGKEE